MKEGKENKGQYSYSIHLLSATSLISGSLLKVEIKPINIVFICDCDFFLQFLCSTIQMLLPESTPDHRFHCAA